MKTAHEIAEQIQHYLSMRLSASADRTKGIESIIECELRELRAECERLRKDKERMDWWEVNGETASAFNPPTGAYWHIGFNRDTAKGSTFRATLDAAVQPSARSK